MQNNSSSHSVVMRDLIGSYDPNLFVPMKTGIDVIDGFWSNKGGVMPSTITMVIGDAGVGKTTVLMVILSHLQKNGYNCLFVSAEMDEIDFADYCFRFEDFKDVPMLFPKYDGPDIINQLDTELANGYDVVVIDSFVELKELVSDQRNSTKSRASNLITSTMKKYKGGVKKYENPDRKTLDAFVRIESSGPKIQKNGYVERRTFDFPFVDPDESVRQQIAENQKYHTHYTSFLVIQQVLKSGKFAGSNSLKHLVSAFLELRFDDDHDMYMKFKKNRRGEVSEKLHYEITKNEVLFDVDRRKRDKNAFDWSKKEKKRKRETETSSITDLLSKSQTNDNGSPDEPTDEPTDEPVSSGELENVPEIVPETSEPGQWDSFNFRRDLDPEVVAEHFQSLSGNVSGLLRHLKREGIIPESMSRYKLQTFINENNIA